MFQKTQNKNFKIQHSLPESFARTGEAITIQNSKPETQTSATPLRPLRKNLALFAFKLNSIIRNPVKCNASVYLYSTLSTLKTLCETLCKISKFVTRELCSNWRSNHHSKFKTTATPLKSPLGDNPSEDFYLNYFQ